MREMVSRSGLAALALVLVAAPAQAEDDAKRAADPSWTNAAYAEKMLERQEPVVGKALEILKARASGQIAGDAVTVSGRFAGSGIFEESNIAGKFPILSRQPKQHSGFTGQTFVVNEGTVALTLPLGPWITLYNQVEYTDIEYPGQDKWQHRKAYVVIGDLKRSPFYAWIGRNTIDFGNFTSFSALTHNHSAHYFWAQPESVWNMAVGYAADGWHVVATAIHGGRGLRVLNSPDEDGIDNFALNASKAIHITDGITLTLGGGYLNSTIYDDTFSHHPPGTSSSQRIRNGAWDVNAMLSWRQLDVMFEFTKTERDWPVVEWPVSAFTAQARYHLDLLNHPTILSVMYSRGEQGASGNNWREMKQLVAGMEVKVNRHLALTAEYIRNEGFAPLVRIVQTSDPDVKSDTAVIGVKVTF
ncbi:MAG: hypothetical protein R3D67_21730 [Hyphomicrobiaceae bacterium]